MTHYAAPATRQSTGQAGQPAEDVRGEVTSGVVTALVVVMVGAPLGFLWAALRPHIDPYVVSLAAESALRPQFGADMRLAGLGVAAGVLVGAGAWLVTRRASRRQGGLTGLGVTIGLAVGGLAAMAVAARTGMLAAHPEHLYRDVNAALGVHQVSLKDPADSVDFLDLLRFRLRAHAVLLAMTAAAPLTYGLLTLLTDRESAPAPGASWGSAGSASAPAPVQP